MMKTSIAIAIFSLSICLLIEHMNYRVYRLLNEIDQRGEYFLDETERRVRQLIHETLLQFNNQTSEQIDSIIEKGRKHIPLQNPYGATTCTEWFGCHHGYCWAGCAGAFPSITGPEWCYTTQSRGKISCSNDTDCHGCWRCSTSCTV